MMKLLFMMSLLASIVFLNTTDSKTSACTKVNPKQIPCQGLEAIVKSKDPYQITFDVDNKTNELLIKIDLEEGSYYLGPNSAETFKGLLKVDIPTNEHIELVGKFSSKPKPTLEENQWGEGTINVIRKNTRHSLGYTLKSDADFNIKGTVQFVIEPKCTMEIIPVTISNKSGRLSLLRNCL
jgi:hypothetical protein